MDCGVFDGVDCGVFDAMQSVLNTPDPESSVSENPTPLEASGSDGTDAIVVSEEDSRGSRTIFSAGAKGESVEADYELGAEVGAGHFGRVYRRRADLPLMNRGDAAAATWTFRGDESRRRRGRDVGIP